MVTVSGILSAAQCKAQEQDFIPIDHKGEAPSTHVAYLQNQGQLTALQGGLVPDIAFYSIQSKPQMFFSKRGKIHIGLGERDTSLTTPDTIYRIDVSFVGSNENCTPTPYEELPEAYNFILGHCPNGIYDVQPTRRLVYADIYPHIDFHVYSNPWGPKFYLVMHPGSDPTQIKMLFQGQDSLKLDWLGFLKAYKESNTVTLPKGLCYQQVGNTTQLVNAALDNAIVPGTGTVAFQFGSYNPEHPLIVDISASFGPGGPEIYPAPEWCTYYGHTELDRAYDAVALTNGNLVTAGTTYSPAFPLFNQQIGSFNGSQEGFFSYFSNEYERRLTTFFGVNGADEVNSLALTSNEQSVYLYGRTYSTDLPVFPASGYSQSSGTGPGCFIAKFSLTSTPLGIPQRVTYFGDQQNTATCACIRTDSEDNVYVAGSSSWPSEAYPLVNTCLAPTTGFPMCNALGTAAYFQNYSGGIDAYFARFNAQFDLVHSTRFGGYSFDHGKGLAIDKDHDLILLTGGTQSQRRP